jgi:hypothetical protein
MISTLLDLVVARCSEYQRRRQKEAQNNLKICTFLGRIDENAVFPDNATRT